MVWWEIVELTLIDGFPDDDGELRLDNPQSTRGRSLNLKAVVARRAHNLLEKSIATEKDNLIERTTGYLNRKLRGFAS
jgi:hypothetical protein